MERVTGIGGIFFKARDPVTLAAWYREHLGIVSQENAAEFEWRARDQPEQIGRTVWSVFPRGTKYFGPDGASFMINYRVANLDRLVAQLGQAGIPLDRPIEESKYGRFAWVTDPEGNRIEIWEPPADYPRPD